MMNVSWFSAGVSSAVATYYALKKYDDLKIIYTHIEDQHPDSMRFVNDCSKWLGVEIVILQSEYKTVDCVVRAKRYVNGPAGARCTSTLKRNVRAAWEQDNDGAKRYFWGFDSGEKNRADRICESMPEREHCFPLIEQHITKDMAHGILQKAGIKRPKMYDLGYHNNNCIGCVKGGKGYWNKIRVDFPDIFLQRAEMEREVGRSCINGVFLDELDPLAGRKDGPIVPDCGIFCDVLLEGGN